MHYHLLEKNSAGSVLDITADDVTDQLSSPLLQDLVNKLVEIKAAAIFSHVYSMSMYAFQFQFHNHSHLSKYCHMLMV